MKLVICFQCYIAYNMNVTCVGATTGRRAIVTPSRFALSAWPNYAGPLDTIPFDDSADWRNSLKGILSPKSLSFIVNVLSLSKIYDLPLTITFYEKCSII